MPENLKALRRRIKSVKSTRQITRAMEMVSAAKLRRTQGLMSAAKPFTLKLQELLGRLAQSDKARENPLFLARTSGQKLLVLFTADRGLCGAFNMNLIKRAEARLREDAELQVFVIGRKGRDHMRKHHLARVVGELVDLRGVVDGAVTDKLGQQLVDDFLAGKYRSIEIVSAEYVSAVLTRPMLSAFLPVTPESFGVKGGDEAASVDYILEPTPERVFEAILPRYLKSKIFLTLAETLTSEHSARMVAMNNATKNCTELATSLTLRANKVRQAAITTEIIEIVSGAEAQKG